MRRICVRYKQWHWFAIIDSQDYARVVQHRWSTIPRGRSLTYVSTKINGQTISLHRFIMRARKGRLIDHRNGNTFDCRRRNLRACNYLQNSTYGRIRRGVMPNPLHQLFIPQWPTSLKRR